MLDLPTSEPWKRVENTMCLLERHSDVACTPVQAMQPQIIDLQLVKILLLAPQFF